MISSRVITGYIPTFTLRGITHTNVSSKYNRGDYIDVNIGEGNLKISGGINLNTGGYNINSETYSYSDKENVTHKIITTNHELYNVFLKSTSTASKCNKCLWCRKELDTTIMNIGIPVKLIIDNNGYTYHVDLPYHCSYGCALATLRRRQSSRIHRDTIYTDSESLLIHQHRILTPSGSPSIKESPDWILRADNGGPLSDEEYYKGIVTYRRSTNVIYLPVKIEYFVNK
jgi:hypothetical protein